MHNRSRKSLNPGGSIVRFYYRLNPLLFDFLPFCLSIKRGGIPLTFPHSRTHLLPVVDFVSIPPLIYPTVEAIPWPLDVYLCISPLPPTCSCSLLIQLLTGKTDSTPASVLPARWLSILVCVRSTLWRSQMLSHDWNDSSDD